MNFQHEIIACLHYIRFLQRDLWPVRNLLVNDDGKDRKDESIKSELWHVFTVINIVLSNSLPTRAKRVYGVAADAGSIRVAGESGFV